MNKRVREIIKMHMNAGLIQPTTWISIIDLSAGSVTNSYRARILLRLMEGGTRLFL